MSTRPSRKFYDLLCATGHSGLPSTMGVQALKYLDSNAAALREDNLGEFQLPESDLGWTPLHRCAEKEDQQGWADVIRTLVNDFGCDPNAASKFGSTPLHLAAHRDLLHTAEVLMECGASPTFRTNHEQSPAVYARVVGLTKMAEFLEQRESPMVKGAGKK
jgi:ankyrin repeat protein